jgi:hypothetical protein
VRQFKLSKDQKFVDKLQDIAGLYMAPHALVLSVDEKSQIQALDQTQPGLPVKKGWCGTMTHDYKRHRTTTLFAVLNMIGRNMQRHCHQEFIRFLNTIEAQVPAGKIIHMSFSIIKRPANTPRCWPGLRGIRALDILFHPSLMLLARRGGGFFAKRVFRPVTDLEAAINRLVAEHNQEPKPLVLIKDQTGFSLLSCEGTKC